ncbi:MAG: thioredoxin domain-containing protein [Bdellovibrionales bacterium]|nr:thioredoxin domain-containing protein [Bdellovibrionales bacterium]
METKAIHPNSPKSNRGTGIISLLSLAGTLISLFQTRQFFETRSGMAAFKTFCNIGTSFDCTAIEMSKYAELFRGFPLSVVAVAGYLTIFMLSLFAMSDAYKSASRKFILVFSGIAVLFSISYLYIMIGIIGKLCLLCLLVDVVNVLLLVFALRLPADDEHARSRMSFAQVGIAGAVGLGIALLFSMALNPQAEMKKDDMNDMVESVLNTVPKDFAIPADAPVIGNPNAKITIVKFSDFECPACKMAANAVHPLFSRYANDVKFVFVNFPLDQACNPAITRKMHEFACEAATVAICAQEQGKYKAAYEVLFENQASFKTGSIADLLAGVPGIDMIKLKSCMSQPSTADKIKRDVELGTKVEIHSTPTFFINGKKVEGGLPTNLWMDVIDKMLKQ